MPTFKEMKKSARTSLKKHYVLFVATLIILMFVCEGRSMTSNFSRFYDTQNENTSKVNSKSFTNSSNQSTNDSVLNLLLSRRTDEAVQVAEEAMNENQDEVPESGRGGNRGIASGIVSTVTSGSVLISINLALTKIFRSGTVAITLIILVILAVYLWFYVFVRNIAETVQARVYLESRIYDKTSLSRLFFFIRNRKWKRVSWIMLVRRFYLMLWSLTIVGGVIKYFSYLMVPYIVSENPDMKANEAINLSRKMMNGHKWEAFKLYLSFIGWFLLAILTFGLLQFLYVAPYLEATFAEYYAQLRKLAKDGGMEGADKLNDEYLFEKADRAVLEDAYADVIAREEQAEAKEEDIQLSKVQNFFAKYLGIWVGSTAMRNQYQEHENLKFLIAQHKERLEGEAYPTRLAPVYYDRSQKKKKKNKDKPVSYNWLRTYTVWNVLAMFLLFCFVGWAWEVGLHIFRDGVFVNRGTLHGPWLPIYGAGGALIIVLLSAFRKNPIAEIILTVVVCGLTEYLSAKIIEDGSLTRYWNYKGYFLNLDGRICFEGMLIFAVMGMVAVYLAAPAIDNLLSKAPTKIFVPIVVVLMATFVADFIYSHDHPNGGAGISEDLCIGGWPQTLGTKDNLPLTKQEADVLNENIADVHTLIKAGVPVSNLNQLELARADGVLDAIEDGSYSSEAFESQLQEIKATE